MVMKSIKGYVIEAYREIFTTEYDVYDQPGIKFSLG